MKRRKQRKVPNLEEGWMVGWHRRRFREVARRPEFQGLITLARLSNLLWFSFTTSVKAKRRGPDERRQSMNAFYLSGTLVVEARKTIEGVGEFFSGQDDFIALCNVANGAEVRTVEDRFAEFRNKAAFHINQENVAPALEQVIARKDAFVPFMTAYGTTKKEGYYDLADDVAMQHIVGPGGYGSEMKSWLERAGTAVVELANALEEFIAGRLESLNPEIVSTEGDRPEDIEETREKARRPKGAKVRNRMRNSGSV